MVFFLFQRFIKSITKTAREITLKQELTGKYLYLSFTSLEYHKNYYFSLSKQLWQNEIFGRPATKFRRKEITKSH
ncbi:MAG: hypothetical protein NZT61_00030 [Deltaproteobacteria bacterium]|nr:hypothetical protein [Deltaproteobacteria bacterium]MCX7952418.1 hypothetical protein [Deltaproteobacteria bacterium]